MSTDFEITPDTVIADVLREHPECIAVFDKYEMPCLTCMGAATGTLGEGAMMHDVDLEKMLADLKQCCAGENDSPA